MPLVVPLMEHREAALEQQYSRNFPLRWSAVCLNGGAPTKRWSFLGLQPLSMESRQLLQR